jgi:hypothetical protein
VIALETGLERNMADVIFLGAGLLFFAMAAAYVAFCDRA